MGWMPGVASPVEGRGCSPGAGWPTRAFMRAVAPAASSGCAVGAPEGMERRQARGSLGVRGARRGRRGRGCGAGRRWQPVLPSRAQHPGVLPDREMARGWRRGDRSARSCGRMQLRPLGDSGRGLQVEPPSSLPSPVPATFGSRGREEQGKKHPGTPNCFTAVSPSLRGGC